MYLAFLAGTLKETVCVSCAAAAAVAQRPIKPEAVRLSMLRQFMCHSPRCPKCFAATVPSNPAPSDFKPTKGVSGLHVYFGDPACPAGSFIRCPAKVP